VLLVGRSRDRFPVVSLGIFPVVPPTEPCALRSTHPLKMSTRDFSWGEGGLCVWLTTYHPCSAETSRKSGALTYPEPLGPPRPVAGHLYLFFLLCIVLIVTNCILTRLLQLCGPGLLRDFPHLSRPAPVSTQPPVQWVPGLSRG